MTLSVKTSSMWRLLPLPFQQPPATEVVPGGGGFIQSVMHWFVSAHKRPFYAISSSIIVLNGIRKIVFKIIRSYIAWLFSRQKPLPPSTLSFRMTSGPSNGPIYSDNLYYSFTYIERFPTQIIGSRVKSHSRSLTIVLSAEIESKSKSDISMIVMELTDSSVIVWKSIQYNSLK